MILGVIEIRGVIEIKERGLSVELGRKLADRCHKTIEACYSSSTATVKELASTKNHGLDKRSVFEGEDRDFGCLWSCYWPELGASGDCG